MEKKQRVVKNPHCWVYNGVPILEFSQIPEGALGFIYKITNLDTGKYYIGRKGVCGNRKRKLTAKEKMLPENKRKTFIIERKESSGWKSYCGSNEVLKEEVKKGDRVVKEILCYCFSKAEMTYMETREILCSGALVDEKSYNGWIKATIYKKFLIK